MSRQDALIVCCLLALALPVGWLTGAVGWSLFIASLVWCALQQRELRRFNHWSKNPLSRPPNQLDSWDTATAPVFKSLRRERGRTRTLLRRLRDLLRLGETIPDAAIIVTEQGDIEDFNSAAQALLQLSAGDRGRRLGTVVRDPDFSVFVRGELDTDQIELRSPFAADRTLEARRFPADGGRLIVLVRDITELNRLLTMRQDFVANVSHELRTPLTVVSGYLETITDPDEPDDLRLSLIDRLRSPISRMQNLVDDLLLLTRLESSPAPAELEPVAMSMLIRRAVQEVEGFDAEPRNAHQVNVHIGSDCKVLGSASELLSICLNLLTNALRYSPDGGQVDVRWEPLPGGEQARLTVRDHGVGIAPEHLERITERFYRVDLADARTRGGTGLGLAIVKHALKRHGSWLQVESEPGAGSTFYCDFDCCDVEALTSPASLIDVETTSAVSSS